MTTFFVSAIVVIVLLVIISSYRRKKRVDTGGGTAVGSKSEGRAAPQASPRPSVPPSYSEGLPEAPADYRPASAPSEDTVYDEVALALSGPGCVNPGQAFNIKFIAYPEKDDQKIEDLLNESDPGNKVLLGLDYCNWQKGTEIAVRLYGDHLEVQQESQKFTWMGRHKILNFDITLAGDAQPGNLVVKTDVLIAGIVIAKLRYTLMIAAECTETGVHVKGKPFKDAFASYANEDRNRVIDRISEIERNGVKVYWDKMSLQPGEVWQQQLDKAIKDTQVFMLFWSAYAKASKWVEWEWKTALQYKGIEGIEPHPLEDPAISPPPDELKALHFDDKYLYFRKQEK